jgi:DASS family divalent anion:Na+ symporter
LIAQLAAGQSVSLTWTTWALAGIVPGLVSLSVVPPMVYRLCPPGVTRTPDAPLHARNALGALGPMTRAEWTMSVVAVLLIGAWIFGAAIAMDATAAALIALAALVVTGVLGWDDITGAREAWDLLFWFGALVMMAGYMTQFGLVAWFTRQVGGTFVGVGWMWGVLGLSLIYFYTHYFFVSNTAHVSAMFAPFLAIAIALGAPPLPAALLLGAFSSIDACLTHYGTPSGPILFASGQVPIGAWWRTGAVLSAVHIAIWLTVGPLWWRLVGVW